LGVWYLHRLRLDLHRFSYGANNERRLNLLLICVANGHRQPSGKKTWRDHQKAGIAERKIRQSNLTPFVRGCRANGPILSSEQRNRGVREDRAGHVEYSNSDPSSLRP